MSLSEVISASSPEAAPVMNGGPLTAELATVRVATLVTGRELRFPIYDRSGLLLLAENQVITSKFKELLHSRGIEEIQASVSEVPHISLPLEAMQLAQASKFDTEVTRKLDSIIESGALFVSNDGPSVHQSLVPHGCEDYAPEERRRVFEQHKQACSELDDLMQNALHGNQLDGERLVNSTAMYLGSMTSDIDNVLSAAQELSRDGTLSQHCLQTSLLAMAIGIEMQLNHENTRTLGLCGLLHDWGMIRVPESIRQAQRRLTAEEFEEVKKHPVYVLDLLGCVSQIPSVVPLVCYQVHERPNGTGYPRERQKGAIHPFARILHVADQYVALTSVRPHRPPLMPYAAMECLLRQANILAVDPNSVRALLQVNSLFPIGSFVTLSDGSVARVLRRNGTHYATPIVQIVQSARGELLRDRQPIRDLAQDDLRVVQALPTPGSGQIALTNEVLGLPN